MSIIVVVLIISGLLVIILKKVYLTPSLLVVNLFIFFISWREPEVVSDLGFKPEYLFSGEKIYTIITSMYLHAGIFHLLFNMIFLVIIGLMLEDKIGTLRYGIIYYFTGFVAVLTFSFTSGYLRPEVTVIGASGGLFGILGAYARLYPEERFAFIPFPYPLPIYTWAFIFFLIAMVGTFVPDICFGRIAHLAHVGGLFGGLAVAPLVMKIKAEEETKKMTEIDYDALEVLAQTDEEKELLEKIKSEDEPEVRDAWLEHFLSKAKCPQCGGMMQVEKRKLKCTCGYELKF